MSDASTLSTPGPLKSAWHIVIGLIVVACGLFALMAPILSTLAMSIVIAVSASVAGAVQIVHGIRSKGQSDIIFNCLLGLIYLAGGVAFWVWPFTGAKFLTLVLAWTLVTAGLAQIAVGLAFRGEGAWRWMLLSGVLALLLGVWLMFRLQIASLFVPGIAWAAALLGEGVALLARALGKSRIEAEDADELEPAEPESSKAAPAAP